MTALASVSEDGALPEPENAPQRWRVRGTRGEKDLETWADILAATHVAFDVRSTSRTPNAFQGAVTRRPFGDLTLLDCECSPFLGRRSPALVEDQPADVVGFQFVGKGVERVREGRREVDLTAGDVMLWDGSQPVDVEVVEPFMKRTLLFPLERVIAVCPRLEEVHTIPPLNRSGAARLLVRYLNAVALELPTLDRGESVAAADAALELLRAAVEPSVPTSRSAKRAALRAEVRRHIRRHLQDARLDPEAIARAQAISVRALHAAFEDTGESVSGLVRRERLSRCYEDLERPSGGSVTEIAFRWGFLDAAHFSRAFKREFDVTPSDVRHVATAER